MESLELRDLSVGYADQPPLLRNVNLLLEEGEMVLVAGRTGVGKSTLLGVISGLVPSFSGGELRGDLLLDGVSIVRSPARERAALIGSVAQDPVRGFVTDTVEEELAYGMEQLGLAPSTMRRRVEETLDLLGLAQLRSRDLRTLSGGEQQRVAIGSVLTMHPQILVLDEPTSALDPTAAEDVLATLSRLVGDLGLTVVLAEHRLERVLPFADRLALLTGDGQVVAGAVEEVLPGSPVVPPLVEVGRLLKWNPLPLTVRDARRRARRMALPQPAPETVAAGESLVKARGVHVRYGSKAAVAGVNLELKAGTITALMGRNGSGKSSLIWALQGSRARAAGLIAVCGEDPQEQSATRRRELVGLVPQTAADLLYLETVAEECAAAGGAPGAALALLERLAPGIDPATHPRDLSEGQRLALALVVVLAARPPVLLLDEPTRGLDYLAKQQLATILRDLADQGHAVLVSTHDVEFAATVADEAMVLAEGEVVSRGTASAVLAESPAFAPQMAKVFGPPWLRVDQVAAAVLARSGHLDE